MLVIDTWKVQRMDTQRPGSDHTSIFQSSKVGLLCDNQAVINAVNNGRSSDDFLSLGMRYIHYQMALVDGQFILNYVNTKVNFLIRILLTIFFFFI